MNCGRWWTAFRKRFQTAGPWTGVHTVVILPFHVNFAGRKKYTGERLRQLTESMGELPSIRHLFLYRQRASAKATRPEDKKPSGARTRVVEI